MHLLLYFYPDYSAQFITRDVFIFYINSQEFAELVRLKSNVINSLNDLDYSVLMFDRLIDSMPVDLQSSDKSLSEQDVSIIKDKQNNLREQLSSLQDKINSINNYIAHVRTLYPDVDVSSYTGNIRETDLPKKVSSRLDIQPFARKYSRVV